MTIRKTITIASAKGGVGKSTICSYLASVLSNSYKVGVLDADIYGPNQDILFDINDKNIEVAKKNAERPYIPKNIDNISLNSLGFLLDKNAAIWRGPMLSSAINQIYEKTKIKEEIEMEDSNLINIKDFTKVELRVAKIVKAEGIEEADKLIKLHLDVGDLGERTVFAGIKSAYDPENLNGRHVVLVANLEPRKMKFGVSEGMVLASSDDDGSIYLISPDEGAKPGQLVK